MSETFLKNGSFKNCTGAIQTEGDEEHVMKGLQYGLKHNKWLCFPLLLDGTAAEWGETWKMLLCCVITAHGNCIA